MSATAFPTLREEIDWLLAQQPLLLKLGVMASRLVEQNELLRWLVAKHGMCELEDVEVAERLTKLMVDALWSLGDDRNPRAQAARVLYGADPATMGLPLKTRRRLAARKLTIDGAEGPRSPSVATFRKLWEPKILLDVSFALAFARFADRTAQSDTFQEFIRVDGLG